MIPDMMMVRMMLSMRAAGRPAMTTQIHIRERRSTNTKKVTRKVMGPDMMIIMRDLKIRYLRRPALLLLLTALWVE